MKRLLAISGSLRIGSSNTAMLNALGQLLMEKTGWSWHLTTAFAHLPAFSPDIEGSDLAVVSEWRSLLGSADVVVIACPEYIHGVPGAFKNGLDWVVGSGELTDKPTLLISSADRATYLRISLADILQTAGASLIHGTAIIIQLPHNQVTKEDILNNGFLCQQLLQVVDDLVRGGD